MTPLITRNIQKSPRLSSVLAIDGGGKMGRDTMKSNLTMLLPRRTIDTTSNSGSGSGTNSGGNSSPPNEIDPGGSNRAVSELLPALLVVSIVVVAIISAAWFFKVSRERRRRMSILQQKIDDWRPMLHEIRLYIDGRASDALRQDAWEDIMPLSAKHVATITAHASSSSLSSFYPRRVHHSSNHPVDLSDPSLVLRSSGRVTVTTFIVMPAPRGISSLRKDDSSTQELPQLSLSLGLTEAPWDMGCRG